MKTKFWLADLDANHVDEELYRRICDVAASEPFADDPDEDRDAEYSEGSETMDVHVRTQFKKPDRGRLARPLRYSSR